MGNRHNKDVRIINPAESPLVHITPTTGNNHLIRWEYIPGLHPNITLEVAALEDKLPEPFPKYLTFKEIVISLLPPIIKDPTKHPPPEYDLEARATAILTNELFGSNCNYLPDILDKHPSANMIALAHGSYWYPVVEATIKRRLEASRYKINPTFYLIGGRKRFETYAILFQKSKP